MGLCMQYSFEVQICNNEHVKNVRIHNNATGRIIFDVTLPTWEAVLTVAKDNVGIAFAEEIKRLIQRDHHA